MQWEFVVFPCPGQRVQKLELLLRSVGFLERMGPSRHTISVFESVEDSHAMYGVETSLRTS